MNLETVMAHLRPETKLEEELIINATVLQGLLWGEPRYGHPEGKVYLHVREVFDNIDCLDISSNTRERLRLIALAHDSFKNIEDKGNPRDWLKHHSMLARIFMEKYTNDKEVLDIIELHDEAYYCWRLLRLEENLMAAQKRLDKLLDRIGDAIQLYYLFFKCDTQTGDKTQASVHWFEQNIKGIKPVIIK